MNNTFGFIGTGNMGGALVRAAARTMPAKAIMVNNRTPEKAQALSRELGCTVATAAEIAGSCGYIFLGVKPHMMQDLLQSIAPVLATRTDEFVLVSMAAGLTMDDIRRMAGAYYPVIRIMPNTPVSVGAGVILYDATQNVSESAKSQFCENLKGAGMVDYLPETLIDAGTAVTGCGPAFVCMILEAIADAGVICGLSRAKAQEYAAKTLLGTSRMILQTQEHPAQMKDAVCSPGGSTIAGIRVLEQQGLRGAIIDGVVASFEKTKALGKVAF